MHFDYTVTFKNKIRIPRYNHIYKKGKKSLIYGQEILFNSFVDTKKMLSLPKFSFFENLRKG